MKVGLHLVKNQQNLRRLNSLPRQVLSVALREEKNARGANLEGFPPTFTAVDTVAPVYMLPYSDVRRWNGEKFKFFSPSWRAMYLIIPPSQVEFDQGCSVHFVMKIWPFPSAAVVQKGKVSTFIAQHKPGLRKEHKKL